MHDQAEDRCHRIGQHDAVTAWYLLAAETIDETMIELIGRKRGIVGAVTGRAPGRVRGAGPGRRARAAGRDAAAAAAGRLMFSCRPVGPANVNTGWVGGGDGARGLAH